MLKEAIITLLFCSPPYTRMYDMSDLLYPPPNFDNAPNFSISIGMMGSFPILTHHPKIVILREKMRIQDIVMGIADIHSDTNTKIMWYGNTMILNTSREVHETLSRH